MSCLNNFWVIGWHYCSGNPHAGQLQCCSWWEQSYTWCPWVYYRQPLRTVSFNSRQIAVTNWTNCPDMSCIGKFAAEIITGIQKYLWVSPSIWLNLFLLSVCIFHYNCWRGYSDHCLVNWTTKIFLTDFMHSWIAFCFIVLTAIVLLYNLVPPAHCSRIFKDNPDGPHLI